MKQKILNLLIIIGLVVVAACATLLGLGKADFDTLWLSYSFWGGLLLICVALNFKFKRYNDLDETVSCARRVRRSISKINPAKEISYVKRLSIQNQLTNAALLLDDLIAHRELYTLRDNLAALNALKDRYKNAGENKMHTTEEELDKDIATLDSLLTELKAIN